MLYYMNVADDWKCGLAIRKEKATTTVHCVPV